jgi:DHA2 family methylenomycin A resistance protein-like MFS transporter
VLRGNSISVTNLKTAGADHGVEDERHTPPVALIVICVGYFLVILDATVVNVALPSMGRDLHGGTSDLQWVVDAYTLTFARLLLTGGALAERLGGRRMFEAGLLLFALSSAVCGLSPTLGILIGARAVQGLGAALPSDGRRTLVRMSDRHMGNVARRGAIAVDAALAAALHEDGPDAISETLATLGDLAVRLRPAQPGPFLQQLRAVRAEHRAPTAGAGRPAG